MDKENLDKITKLQYENYVLLKQIKDMQNSRTLKVALVIKEILRKTKLLLFIKGVLYIKNFGLKSFFIKIFSLNTRKKKIYKNSFFYKEISIPSFDYIDVSIIIPVYNKYNYTLNCIRSIITNSNNVSYEIIIADDCSNDQTINIHKKIKNIKIVKTNGNFGFLKNCNNASKFAQGKYILFLNNDTIVQKNWLSPLIDLMLDNKIGLVGSKLIYPNGILQEAGGIIWNDATGCNYGHNDDSDKSEYNYVKEADYISGASIMIRKPLWDEIGGFDERYTPAYYEDTDIAYEVRKRGFKVMYQPKSVVIHFEGVSNGKNLNSGIKQYQVQNKEKFFLKWKNVLAQESFPPDIDLFHARNRLKNKKTIVVVDHDIPEFDTNAGARCTYQYLKIMVKMGLNVIFIPDSFNYKEYYTYELQKLGIEVIYGLDNKYNFETWVKKNALNIDFIYLQRPDISGKYIYMFKNLTNAKIIFFPHDLHHIRELRQYEIEHNNKLLKSAADWKKIEFNIINISDVIHVVGDFEQAYLQKNFPDKKIRNIPLYLFEKSINDSYNYSQRDDILFVGGFRHLPNIDAIEWFVNKIFPKIIQKIPNIKFYIVGSNPTKAIKQYANKSIIVTGFISDEELNSYYNKCKIVVAPLRYGAGVKGKIVEAISKGVPVVTTTIGAEGLPENLNMLTIDDTKNGFADKVIQLYNNENKLTDISLKSADYINKYFSENRAIEILTEDLLL